MQFLKATKPVQLQRSSSSKSYRRNCRYKFNSLAISRKSVETNGEHGLLYC